MSTVSSICYHYIAREDKFKKIWGHTWDLFKKHINFIDDNYDIIDPAKIIKQEFENDKNYMLLTFDDGLKEHVKISQYLNGLGLKGIFAIPSCILNDEPASPQIIHFSAAYYGNRGFYDLVVNEVKNNFKQHIGLFPQNLQDMEDIKLLKNLKRIFKYDINHVDSRMILLAVYENNLKKDFPDLMDLVHLSKSDIVNLIRDGHTIAVHTMTHPSVKEIEDNDKLLSNEVVQAKIELEKLINQEIEVFAYPFGRESDILSKPDYLKENNYKLILTTYQESDNFDLLNLGRYCSQSNDSVEMLTKNLWKYKIN